jgi:uncharacterized membrane protein YjjP (DUF1212 family)
MPDPNSVLESPSRDTVAELEKDAMSFVLELARALHEFGTPAHQLEVALETVAGSLGLTAEFFSSPTSIMVGFGYRIEQRVHLLRVEPADPNLGKLAQLDSIVRDVVDGRIGAVEGQLRVHAVKSEAPLWPSWLTLLAFVCASGAVACFLHVEVGDVAVAALLGLVTGLITLATSGSRTSQPVIEPLAAFAVTTIALTIDVFKGTGTGFATSLAGLIVLLPGLTLTIALTELSTRHLVSGTARLSGVIIVFLGLGFGLALGAELGGFLGVELKRVLQPDALAWLSRASLPAWAEWAALLIAPLAFSVLLKAALRDIGWILLTCAGAYLTSRFVGASIGEEFGAFLGAFVVSAGSNMAERLFRRSSIVTAVPGLLILVPGAIGFRSVTSMVGDQYEDGIAIAFHMGLIGISLVAGMLVGNVATSAIKHRRL